MYKHNINLLLYLYNYSFMTAVMYVMFEITFAFLGNIHIQNTTVQNIKPSSIMYSRKIHTIHIYRPIYIYMKYVIVIHSWEIGLWFSQLAAPCSSLGFAAETHKQKKIKIISQKKLLHQFLFFNKDVFFDRIV